jgi:hypothetical protein
VLTTETFAAVTVDGSHHGPYLALVPERMTGYEPVRFTRATAERVVADLLADFPDGSILVDFDGDELVFVWDATYNDSDGMQIVRPDADGLYPIGGLWPWEEWTDCEGYAGDEAYAYIEGTRFPYEPDESTIPPASDPLLAQWTRGRRDTVALDRACR